MSGVSEMNLNCQFRLLIAAGLPKAEHGISLPTLLSRTLQCLILGTFLAEAAVAQKVPALGYVYPPAMSPGTTAEVHAGGFDFTSDMQWMLHHDAIRLETDGIPGPMIDPPGPYWSGPRAAGPSLPIPREVKARIVIPSGTPEGLVRWQVANANGASGSGVFYVGGSHEIIESRSRDLPQVLTQIPVAVSGRISRLTEVDRYEFQLPEKGWVTAELMARRLGADFAGVIEARDSQGNLLADYVDTRGTDGWISFPVPAGEVCTVSVRDADFRGDRAYVYRLALTASPKVISTLPAAITKGVPQEITFFGHGITEQTAASEVSETASGDASKASANRGQGLKRTVTVPVDFPDSLYPYSLETPAGVVTVPLRVSSLPELSLAEQVLKDASGTVLPETTDVVAASGNAAAAAASPADAARKSWALAAPVAVTGLMPADIEEHRFQWSVEKDQYWKLDAQSRAVGGSLDMAMTILSPSGQTVVDIDDVGGTTDAAHEFRATESGLFTVVVRSISTRSGFADELYRLQILRPEPGFSLTAPQLVNVPSGGKAEMPVQVTRSGGFDGEIALELTGLPEGVSVEGASVIPAGAAEVKLPLTASAEAEVTASLVRVSGRTRIADQEVTQIATAVAGGNLAPATLEDARTPRTLVAMTMPAPIDVLITDRDAQHDVPRGTTFLADVEIVRKAPFTGPVRLETSANQQRYRAGIRSTYITVPSEETKTQFPCFMPEWLATDLTQRMLIHGIAEVPDPKGNIRQLTKAGNARITMIMEGALLKLSAVKNDFVVQAGEPIEIPFRLQRSPKLPLSTTVQVEIPDEAAGLITATPVVISPEQTEGFLQLTSKRDERLNGSWKLRLSAQSLQQDRWPVISEAEISVEFTISKQSASVER